MPDTICENALAREAHILIRRLEKSRGFVLKAETTDWDIFSVKNGYRRPIGRAPDQLIAAMQSRGLLAPRPGGGLVPTSQSNHLRSEVTRDGHGKGVLHNEAEWALGWLRARHDSEGNPLITNEQFAAAEILRRDYTAGQMEPRITQNWDRPADVSVPGSRGAARLFPSDRAVAARQRLHAALDAVGPELSGILLEVCCMAAGLEQAERALGLPQRSGKPILQIALTGLARHYGLIERVRPRHAAIGHWGRDDYRPRLAPF